jgi:hypothetical protein
MTHLLLLPLELVGARQYVPIYVGPSSVVRWLAMTKKKGALQLRN